MFGRIYAPWSDMFFMVWIWRKKPRVISGKKHGNRRGLLVRVSTTYMTEVGRRKFFGCYKPPTQTKRGVCKTMNNGEWKEKQASGAIFLIVSRTNRKSKWTCQQQRRTHGLTIYVTLKQANCSTTFYSCPVAAWLIGRIGIKAEHKLWRVFDLQPVVARTSADWFS